MARTVTLSTGSASVTLDATTTSTLTDDEGVALTDDAGATLTITGAPNHATSVTITES